METVFPANYYSILQFPGTHVAHGSTSTITSAFSLSFFYLLLSYSVFPSNSCTRLFPVKANAIDLKILHIVQNDINYRSNIFWKSDLR